jgi:hypothetical protein
MNQLGAQAQQQQTQGMNSLSSRGMMNPAALARMNERLGANADATLSRAMAGTEIERATRRNQDIQNAAALASGLGQQAAGLNLDVNKTYLENMPQYAPEDLSGIGSIIMAMQQQANAANTPVGGGGGFGLGLNNNSSMYANNSGLVQPGTGQAWAPWTGLTANPWGQVSPGQTGYGDYLQNSLPQYFQQQAGTANPNSQYSQGYQNQYNIAPYMGGDNANGQYNNWYNGYQGTSGLDAAIRALS